jgi:putative ABC transport system substrate-binding protein
MACGTNFFDQCKRAAAYVDKILKDSRPADLPVERVTMFEFVINLKTAKMLTAVHESACGTFAK